MRRLRVEQRLALARGARARCRRSGSCGRSGGSASARRQRRYASVPRSSGTPSSQRQSTPANLSSPLPGEHAGPGRLSSGAQDVHAEALGARERVVAARGVADRGEQRRRVGAVGDHRGGGEAAGLPVRLARGDHGHAGCQRGHRLHEQLVKFATLVSFPGLEGGLRARRPPGHACGRAPGRWRDGRCAGARRGSRRARGRPPRSGARAGTGRRASSPEPGGVALEARRGATAPRAWTPAAAPGGPRLGRRTGRAAGRRARRRPRPRRACRRRSTRRASWRPAGWRRGARCRRSRPPRRGPGASSGPSRSVATPPIV